MGRIATGLGSAAALLAMAVARAEEAARQAGQEAVRSGADKLRDMGLAGAPVEGPGIGRVLLAFVLVAGLAWGATWVLKRYGFRGTRAVAGSATSIRHLARSALPGGIACHVVETQGRQVLITVTRNGVASLVLGDAAAATTPPPVAPAPDPGVAP